GTFVPCLARLILRMLGLESRQPMELNLRRLMEVSIMRRVNSSGVLLFAGAIFCCAQNIADIAAAARPSKAQGPELASGAMLLVAPLFIEDGTTHSTLALVNNFSKFLWMLVFCSP